MGLGASPPRALGNPVPPAGTGLGGGQAPPLPRGVTLAPRDASGKVDPSSARKGGSQGIASCCHGHCCLMEDLGRAQEASARRPAPLCSGLLSPLGSERDRAAVLTTDLSKTGFFLKKIHVEIEFP